MTVCLCGGDARSRIVAQYLRARGVTVHCAGLSKKEVPLPLSPSFFAEADAILLPLPYTKDGVHLNAPLCPTPIPLSALSFPPHSRILCGKADFALRAQAEAMRWQIEDYATWESFQVANAVPSAEGAIALALQRKRRCLYQEKVVVLGFGRIARHLCRLLTAFGAQVSVCARKESDRFFAQQCGLQALPFSQKDSLFADCTLLYNTVPCRVLEADSLSLFPKDALLIDLASAPGGIDFVAAAQLRLHTVWARSLPAEWAPDTAGEILGAVLFSHLFPCDLSKKGGAPL